MDLPGNWGLLSRIVAQKSFAPNRFAKPTLYGFYGTNVGVIYDISPVTYYLLNNIKWLIIAALISVKAVIFLRVNSFWLVQILKYAYRCRYDVYQCYTIKCLNENSQPCGEWFIKNGSPRTGNGE
jgi:hypothetical protein